MVLVAALTVWFQANQAETILFIAVTLIMIILAFGRAFGNGLTTSGEKIAFDVLGPGSASENRAFELLGKAGGMCSVLLVEYECSELLVQCDCLVMLAKYHR
ncbi:hypothetical protein JTB14_018752 [Gonioctena quinquepunctata]|nr:hypothetical protein JTB14_018752 [Gonioctena quinquepunctata]